MLLVQTVRIPASGVEAFQRYESRVLPLMSKYGGVLERRLRTADALSELISAFRCQKRSTAICETRSA